MEDDDNSSNLSNPFHNDDDQNRIVQQLLLTNISGRTKELFWYDAQNLPDSLLIEILARLPVKSIFMFKSVCKHWETLISHPSFSRFYHSILDSNAAALPFRILERYTDVPNFKEFVDRLAPEIHSLSEFSVLFLSTPEEQYGDDQIRVLDMSNGLILCCSWSTTPFVYYICDPLTRLWITIPRCGPQISHANFNVGLITSVNEDRMLTGYTVIWAGVLKSPSNYLILNINMFSSETGEWIDYELSCVTPIRLRKLDGGPIHCYGAVHWPVSRHQHGDIDGMVAFEPYKDPKSIRLIPLPEGRVLETEDDDFGVFQLCGESQGTLRYFEVAHYEPSRIYSLTMTMWAMKDYEKGEWCCEFKVRRSDLHSTHLELSNWLLDGWFEPLSFHPLNPNVVYLRCMKPECVVSYNILDKKLDVVSYNVLNERLDVACEESPDVASEEFQDDASEEWHFCRSISSYFVIPYVLPRWPMLASIATVNSKIKG